MNSKRLMLFVTVAIMVSAFLVLPHVYAEPNGTTNLTNPNVTEFAGIVVSVTVSHSGSGAIVFSVQLVTNPLTNTPLGIDKFFYNGAAAIASYNDPGCSHGWSGSGGGTGDGFGSFDSSAACSAGDGGISGPIVFTLDSDPTIASNGNGAKYTVHIRYVANPGYDSCSAWVSDGTPSATSSEPGCTPQIVIPENSLYLLFLAPLIPAFFIVRRRKQAQTQ